MKKNGLLTFVLLIGLCFISTAQVPNAGFENWTGGNPDGWATSNVFEAGLVNVFQTDDRHSGDYALRGEVVSFFGTPMAAIIQSGPAGTGFAIDKKYQSFDVYYKFTSVGGDRFAVNVGLYKDGNPIAIAAAAIPTTLGSYTYLSVPFDYQIDETPDTAIIQLSINGPNTGTDFHLGSLMFVDDVALSMETGIPEPQGGEIIARCYPNPASDVVNIVMNQVVTGDIYLKVYDICGKEQKSLQYSQFYREERPMQVPVSDLGPGVYIYKLEAGKTTITGKFYVK